MPAFKMQITSWLMFGDSLMASTFFKNHALRFGSARRSVFCVLLRREKTGACDAGMGPFSGRYKK